MDFSFTEALTLIGAVFLLISVVFGIGGIIGAVRRGSNLELSKLISVSGNIGLTIWILIVFVLAGWLVSVLYWQTIECVWWISEKTSIPFLLILPLLIFFIAVAVALYQRIKSRKPSADPEDSRRSGL